MRTVGILVSAIVVSVLVGCSGLPSKSAPEEPESARNPTAVAEPKPSAAPTPKPALEPWAGPTDGTWDWGDVGFQQPVPLRLADHTVTVSGIPTFGPLDNSRVTITGTFTVERTKDDGWYDKIADDIRFGFVPGNYGYPTHDEVYGLNVKLDCVKPALSVGEVTTCKVIFNAPVEEMQDSHWWVSGKNVAAWPGQIS